MCGVAWKSKGLGSFSFFDVLTTSFLVFRQSVSTVTSCQQPIYFTDSARGETMRTSLGLQQLQTENGDDDTQPPLITDYYCTHKYAVVEVSSSCCSAAVLLYQVVFVAMVNCDHPSCPAHLNHTIPPSLHLITSSPMVRMQQSALLCAAYNKARPRERSDQSRVLPIILTNNSCG